MSHSKSTSEADREFIVNHALAPSYLPVRVLEKVRGGGGERRRHLLKVLLLPRYYLWVRQ